MDKYPQPLVILRQDFLLLFDRLLYNQKKNLWRATFKSIQLHRRSVKRHSTLTSYGFTGEQSDASGLTYLRARYYNPATGTFTSRDPFGGVLTQPATLNAYTYALNNPLRYTDPSGEFIDTVIDIASVGFDLYTIVDKYNRGCSIAWSDWGTLGLDVLSMAIPFVPAGGMWLRIGIHVDDTIDLLNAVDNVHDLGNAVSTTGQWHHILSNKIMKAIDNHTTLKGAFKRNDFLVQAVDKINHKGYQEWHRNYDDEVVKWLKDNPDVDVDEFLLYIQQVYQSSEMSRRFPNADAFIQMIIEEFVR